MTPFTVSPVAACHIWVARAALASKRGELARFRHSAFGCNQPQLSAMSPVRGTASVGSGKAVVDLMSPRSNCPSWVVITPTLRNAPEPMRISELFAAKTR